MIQLNKVGGNRSTPISIRVDAILLAEPSSAHGDQFTDILLFGMSRPITIDMPYINLIKRTKDGWYAEDDKDDDE